MRVVRVLKPLHVVLRTLAGADVEVRAIDVVFRAVRALKHELVRLPCAGAACLDAERAFYSVFAEPLEKLRAAVIVCQLVTAVIEIALGVRGAAAVVAERGEKGTEGF